MGKSLPRKGLANPVKHAIQKQMSFLDSILKSDAASGLAGKAGVSPDKVAELLPSIAPMILGAVEKQAGDDDDKVEQLLEKHADEAAEAAPEDLLGEEGAAKATDMVSSKLGIAADAAKGFLPKIISFVMGMLKKTGGGGMDVVRGLLSKEGDSSMLGNLTSMLGKDGGGLGTIAGGLFGGSK